jgi:AcrR family transcriptional regulator
MGKAERTKQLIIEKAATIYNEKGIAGATIDEVLDAAKVARGCLYGHFESKDALSYATVEFLLKKNEDVIMAYVNKEKTAKAKIFAYLNFSKNPLNTHIDGGCPMFNMAVEADDNNPVIKEMVKDTILSGQKFFTTILSTGIKNGEFKKTLDAKDFAYKMFAAIEGSTVICRILGTNQPMLSLIKSLKLELEAHEVE